MLFSWKIVNGIVHQTFSALFENKALLWPCINPPNEFNILHIFGMEFTILRDWFNYSQQSPQTNVDPFPRRMMNNLPNI